MSGPVSNPWASSGPRIYAELLGKKVVCMMDVLVHSTALAASLFFVTLGSPRPRYLVLLRHAASPLFKIT